MDRNRFLSLLGMAGLFPFAPAATRKVTGAPSTVLPPRLPEGGTIGLVSPASILPERDLYSEIAETIRSLGFSVKLGEYAMAQRGYFAGEDAQRAQDLNRMFADPDVDAILPFRGGWGSNRILDALDYKVIADNPKPLIGFSDITSLLLAIYARTGLVSFHGPVGKSEWTDFTLNQFRQVVVGGQTARFSNPAGSPTQALRGGKAEGVLLGGNLTVLTSMIGSDYLPDFSGAILFLEDVGEDVYRIDRMLTQLKLSGILDQIGGLAFGQCTDCRPSNRYSLTLQQVLEDHILPLEIPAYRGAMIGHIDDMFTLPVGMKVHLNAAEGALMMTGPAVR